MITTRRRRRELALLPECSNRTGRKGSAFPIGWWRDAFACDRWIVLVCVQLVVGQLDHLGYGIKHESTENKLLGKNYVLGDGYSSVVTCEQTARQADLTCVLRLVSKM